MTTPRTRLAYLLVVALCVPACAIDRSISVDDNQENKTYRIIDGDLDVGTNAKIGNGWVVDGEVSLHEGSVVKGDITLTDGVFSMGPGAAIEGEVVLRHVDMDLRAAVIEGDVDTICTGGRLSRTRIDGELRIRDKALWYKDCGRSTTLTIGPGSDISRLRIESERVNVVVEEGATIHRIGNDVQID